MGGQIMKRKQPPTLIKLHLSQKYAGPGIFCQYKWVLLLVALLCHNIISLSRYFFDGISVTEIA